MVAHWWGSADRTSVVLYHTMAVCLFLLDCVLLDRQFHRCQRCNGAVSWCGLIARFAFPVAGAFVYVVAAMGGRVHTGVMRNCMYSMPALQASDDLLACVPACWMC